MSETSNIDDALLDTLPGVLREIATRFGFQRAMHLAKWRGGIPLYVPDIIQPDHIIVQKLGAEAAQWLAAEYGSSNLMIPRAEATLRHIRDTEIRQRREDGQSLNSLAEQYETSQRNILRILSQQSVEPTPDLFS